VAQESLRNISKHAEAGRITLTVERSGDTATLVVEDDGKGFDPATVADVQREGHVGVRVLEDLVHDAGGELTIDSQPGQGTRVRARVVLA
jgi:two-component system, NarL family, sensor kinase